MSSQRHVAKTRNKAIDRSSTEAEGQKLTSSKVIYDHQHIGGLFGVKTLQSTEDMTATDLPTQYEGFPIDPKYLKGLILNQSNKAKIRPVLLSLGGIPKSGKSKAVSHLLKRYVDTNFFNPMTKKSERSEGIPYYELIATSYHSKRNLTITEVTKESCCAFGILSALRNELLANGKVPLLDIPERSRYFADVELDNLLCHMFQYLYEYEHTPRGNEVTDDEQEYARHLNKLLPEGIGLIHIWDIASNKMVLHFLNSLHGLIYNSHMWLFLDIDRDLKNFEKPLKFLDETRIGASSSDSGRADQSVLMKWRPRLHYLFRLSRMSERKHGPRKGTCTIYARHEGAYNEDLKRSVKKLEGKVKQAAKHYSVFSLVEPKIETINFNVSDFSDDSSLHLYQKFQQLIYQTPYENVPLSWVFLRSLFYHSKKKFIAKSELRKKAKECGMDDKSFTKFCEFYTSFGSIFDLSLINPDYLYVIVKPMGFLKSLDKFLCPDDSTCQHYPTLMNGIIPEKACKDAFGENYWSVYMEALISVNLATKIPSSQLDVPNSGSNDTYYFIPLSRKGSFVMEPDPSAVHLITSINTPDIFTLAILTKYLLRLLPEPKLVPCSNINKTIIKECSTGSIITLVSYSPATKIAVDQATPKVCSLIIKAYNEIAEMCKTGTPKYKFVMICAKSIIPTVRDIPYCQYHVLPNDTLCDECVIAERGYGKLLSWNVALRKYPIPRKCVPNEELKVSEPTQIAEKIASFTLEVIPYLAEALQLDPSQSSSVSAMISSWNKKLVKSSLTDTIEPRRILARKLVEVCAKLCSSLDYVRKVEAESTFETLARELDVHTPSVKQLRAITPHLTEQDNEITRDVYEKYSEEDGVIPFKAVKWILIGPPQVGKTTTKMRLLNEIHNIESESINKKPDSTGIEKPVEVMSATMIPGSESKHILYWKALSEMQLDKASLCYINSQSTFTKEHSPVRNRKESHLSECIDTMLKEPAENNENDFVQNNRDNTKEVLSMQSRKRSHDSDSSNTLFKKPTWSDKTDFAWDYKGSSQEHFSIFQSRKRSHSFDSMTVFKKPAHTFENDKEDFPQNYEESNFDGATMDTACLSDTSSDMEVDDYSNVSPVSVPLSKKEEKGAVINFIKRHCNDENFLELFEEVKDSIFGSTFIYITDTGGQPEFLRLLPVILSKPAFYFVFFSLAQHLDQSYAVQFTKDGQTQMLYKSPQTVKEVLGQLLSSLHIRTRDEKYSKVKSRALLFGTNADHPYDDVNKINVKLKEILPSDSNYVTSVESKFKTVFIPVNNMSGTEDEIISIRQYLEELVNDIEPVNIPVRWLIFHLLLRKRFKDAKVCSLEDCERLANKCSIAKHHVKGIITYIHQHLGTILYYNKVDENVIICVPDVLLKIISQLIFASVTESVEDKSTHGEIHEDFLNFLMRDKETYGMLDSQYVIKVMKHFQLVTQLTDKDEISSDCNIKDSAPLFFPGVLRPDYNNNMTPSDHDIRTTLLISFGNDEMPPHLFQNLIVALRAQSMELESRLMWTLSHDHSRYSDHIYFKVSYCNEEWLVELQLRKCETMFIEVRCEPTKVTSDQSIHHIVYKNMKKVLHLICDIFPHTRYLKPMYGAYCQLDDSLHFSEYDEEKSIFLCKNCDWDKSLAMHWFQLSEEMDDIQTKDGEVQFESATNDAIVQFDYFVPLIDNLPNAYIAGQRLFVIQGDLFQSFNWDECGLRLSCPKGALSSSNEKCEVAIVALAGGQFKIPEGTKLVSSIYAISISRTLLKPLTLELQHCVALETKAQVDRLKFVRASVSDRKFSIMEGEWGKFYPGSWYGSITRYHFCKCAIVQVENQSVEQHIDTDHQYVTTDRIAYFCKVYYENVASLEWSVKLSIVRRLKALEEYMRQKHPEAVAYCFDTVLPSGDSFNFVLDNKPPQGWSIYQLTTNSEFEYKFIDKFVSDELPEPPSCSMIIKAKYDADTEEVFHYSVPLDGVDKPQQIFIYLSLKSNSVSTAGPPAVLETENITFDVEKASKIAKEVLKKFFASLGGLLHRDPLEKVIQRMYAENMVSVSVNSSPDYNNMMSEYNVLLDICSDVSEFTEYCTNFIRILSDQGGPLQKISNRIAADWTKEIAKQLHVNLNFTAE